MTPPLTVFENKYSKVRVKYSSEYNKFLRDKSETEYSLARLISYVENEIMDVVEIYVYNKLVKVGDKVEIQTDRFRGWVTVMSFTLLSDDIHMVYSSRDREFHTSIKNLV
jgi:hypothetical protein